MSYIYGRSDRFYCAKQSNYYTVATVAATDACKHKSFTATPARPYLQPQDKEINDFLGYIDHARPGRFSAAAASVTTPLFSGTGAGVAPDNGPILESAFGLATAGSGTLTYSLLPTGLVTCSLFGFNTAAKRAMIAHGALVNRLRISAGQDYAEMNADFLCYNVLTQDRFPAASAAEKGGLGAFPSEPGSQTYTGAELQGFTGSLTLDGHVFTAVRNISINMAMARQFRADKFVTDGTEYLPTEPFELMPEITLDVDLWSLADSTDLDGVIAKIAARTAFDATVVIGATAGGIYTFALNNLIMPDGHEAVHSDGDDRKVISLSGLRAQCTSTSVRDEITLTLT